jgi:3-isopropylmalate dehydrogenase
MTQRVLVLAGDGVGPEITVEAEKVLDVLISDYGLDLQRQHGLVGGAAIDAEGVPLPDTTLAAARAADAVLLSAIGGPEWDGIERHLRPERGLLALRAGLGAFANLRPVMVYPELAGASSLKPELVSGLDIMIVRELTGGIYFGEPRGIEERDGRRAGFNTMVYDEAEIERIGRVAFDVARKRRSRVISVDKANVLEVSELWRGVMTDLAAEYPDVELQHMYVDNAAMQLVRDPQQFDVMVTGNMFGDILSDLASMLSGSIGMLPSASLNGTGRGLYEPVHGSAPDIAGTNQANPLAMILSAAMMLRYSLDQVPLADKVESAVRHVLAEGLRTADIHTRGMHKVTTSEMGDAVVAALKADSQKVAGDE